MPALVSSNEISEVHRGGEEKKVKLDFSTKAPHAGTPKHPQSPMERATSLLLEAALILGLSVIYNRSTRFIPKNKYPLGLLISTGQAIQSK